MTYGQALQNFFSGFGMPAYTSTSVDSMKDIVFPYLTYETPVSAFNNGEVNCTVNMWFYTESEATPNQKAKAFIDAIGLGGKLLTFDGGAVWIKYGSPLVQSLIDADNNNVKRRYINLNFEFL